MSWSTGKGPDIITVGQQRRGAPVPTVIQPSTVLTGPERVGIMQRQLAELGALRGRVRPRSFDAPTVRAVNAAIRSSRYGESTARMLGSDVFPFTEGTLNASAQWCESAGLCHFPTPGAWAARQRLMRSAGLAPGVVLHDALVRPAQGAALVAISVVDMLYREARHLPGTWNELTWQDMYGLPLAAAQERAELATRLSPLVRASLEPPMPQSLYLWNRSDPSGRVVAVDVARGTVRVTSAEGEATMPYYAWDRPRQGSEGTVYTFGAPGERIVSVFVPRAAPGAAPTMLDMGELYRFASAPFPPNEQP